MRPKHWSRFSFGRAFRLVTRFVWLWLSRLLRQSYVATIGSLRLLRQSYAAVFLGETVFMVGTVVHVVIVHGEREFLMR